MNLHSTDGEPNVKAKITQNQGGQAVEFSHDATARPAGSMAQALMQSLMIVRAEIAGQNGIEHRREGIVLDVDISVLDGTRSPSTKMILWSSLDNPY